MKIAPATFGESWGDMYDQLKIKGDGTLIFYSKNYRLKKNVFFSFYNFFI